MLQLYVYKNMSFLSLVAPEESLLNTNSGRRCILYRVFGKNCTARSSHRIAILQSYLLAEHFLINQKQPSTGEGEVAK